MATKKEIKAVEKAEAIEQMENIKQGANTEEIFHMPLSIREALTKEEIYLTELIDESTKKIKEIQEFRKNFI